ncbi:hypothetical protein I3843_11G123500 [Carya illinoinensis]|uniref:Peptidase C45 hydrolase domain-containing protein n=1 Tax=Carya illinoinensis TaxID=32201 RepID=A0A8T1P304_CARIL|nr:uncharacterized protein LOC122281340 isoform X3 [Carya illinoinensis]KAG2680963.1 hypothetical protein I3760_11G123100 [Carya illinoinensis]KAG6636658.1 hypothetical protein CIPAW_11G126100 [Carya illinoinensis]KAG6688437.1 hypothetical protein I3842_11G125200 [Carya illinoinensis]KAG7956417.1 hypothetical protein I3843_11G123500 [Carya illinoinensis]
MGSSVLGAKLLEMFEVGPCGDAYQMGMLIGQRFSSQIRSRLAGDLVLRDQLLPFAQTQQAQPLLKALTDNNRKKFPKYWDELLGTAEGSGVPVLDLILINFRKEIVPFLPKTSIMSNIADTVDDCSDVLIVSDSLALAVHNEDANFALVGHTYLIKGTLANGLSFVAYTYAGELPSCAFGFNSHGLAFTLNSVPPTQEEIIAGGIGRNFVSRDLLEASDIDDALTVQDENSISRQNRAALLPKRSRKELLSVLGDTDDPKYPIYMTGPTLYTLCTAVIDLDEQTLSIIEGNPKEEEVSHVFIMSAKEFKMPQ